MGYPNRILVFELSLVYLLDIQLGFWCFLVIIMLSFILLNYHKLLFILLFVFLANTLGRPKFIKKIIAKISNKLNQAHLTATPYIVGMESRVKDLNMYLDRYAEDVCMVGIWGVAGIGKTTIAQEIYNLLRREFQVSCFLENVRSRAQQLNGLIVLQEQFLSCIDQDVNKKVTNVAEGTSFIRDKIKGKKVLVVLDDVDDLKQLDKVGIEKDNFHPGSRIIVTTRNMEPLAKVDMIYTLPALSRAESLQLFGWYAYRKDNPIKNYVELSKKVIYYTGGVPLMLKVLGSSLFDKEESQWRGVLKKLKKSRYQILETLMVSFDLLSDRQQMLFLDIAHFYIGYEFKILQDAGLYHESELGDLGRRGLVAIDCSKRLTMHDLIINMAKVIVHRQSPEELRKFGRRRWSHGNVLVRIHDQQLSLI